MSEWFTKKSKVLFVTYVTNLLVTKRPLIVTSQWFMKILEPFHVNIVAKSLFQNPSKTTMFQQFMKNWPNTNVNIVKKLSPEKTITRCTWERFMSGPNLMYVNIVAQRIHKWVICIDMSEKFIMLNPIKFELENKIYFETKYRNSIIVGQK